MDFLNLTQTEWQQIGISALILAASLVLTRPVLNFLLNKVISRLTRITRSNLDDDIVQALHLPLYWLVVLVIAEAAVARLDFLDSTIREYRDSFFYISYALLILVACWRLVNAVANWYQNRPAGPGQRLINTNVMPLARQVVLLLLVVLVGISVLGHFEIEVGGLVATLGIGSLAVALAAQAALSDTISGFVIMIDQPFRIGHRIEILDIEAWGDVVDIGLRSTRILTPDNRMVIIPNSVIAKSLVVNRTDPHPEYRITTNVGVTYGADLEEVRQTLINAVRGLEGVSQDHPVEALFLEFGDSSLNFEVRWWIETYQDIYIIFDRVNTAVYNGLASAGIAIPFPQRDLHHKLDPGTAAQLSRAFGQASG
ncbi:MAG: mechanosensitive ion channel family protein [Anaerolineales bacterium]|jgi:small-conductance mechanosensitive channel